MANGGFGRPGIPTGHCLRNVSLVCFPLNQKAHIIFSFFRMQAVQNLGMAVVTMLAGRIVDGQGYLVLEVFFLAWLCCKCSHLEQTKANATPKRALCVL